jgi:hypothetical protein
MEKILKSNLIWLKGPLFATVLILASLLSFSAAFAGTYSAWFTAYAMGNRYGSSGYEVVQTSFANHLPDYCPDDPAADWLWGSNITTQNSIGMQNVNGTWMYYTVFYLRDGGDLSCSQGDYWVDIYMGRYKKSTDSCNCPGSPSPGYCLNAVPNSCTNATDFGHPWRTYTGP